MLDIVDDPVRPAASEDLRCSGKRSREGQQLSRSRTEMFTRLGWDDVGALIGVKRNSIAVWVFDADLVASWRDAANRSRWRRHRLRCRVPFRRRSYVEGMGKAEGDTRPTRPRTPCLLAVNDEGYLSVI